MHKKFYFAGAFIFTGMAMGCLAFAGLRQIGFANRGPIPMVAILGVSASVIVLGLLFIIVDGSKKK